MKTLKQQIMDKYDEARLKRDLASTPSIRAWYQRLMDAHERSYKNVEYMNSEFISGLSKNE